MADPLVIHKCSPDSLESPVSARCCNTFAAASPHRIENKTLDNNLDCTLVAVDRYPLVDCRPFAASLAEVVDYSAFSWAAFSWACSFAWVAGKA